MVELKGDNSRLQSSLGSELINDNMSNAVGKLSLARVTDINYQKNTATFIRFLSTGGTDVSGATSEALLPMPSAGRNGFGNAYGEVLPIHPGDIVLVGYVGDRLDKPIILARYGDASIAQEISGQQSPHYEVNDFSAYGKANQSMVVYPSQEYDLMDGKGNRSIKLAGNTFVLVRNDIPQASRGTDDGVQPVASSDIPGNVDGNGKSRNSLVQNAPEIIFGHRGNITTGGDKDNHATYVRIGDDGNFRLSQMQDNQDWRTYFEMTPDGKIRLRRQEDAKIFNTGLKSSEISIDNNGYVTLRSQSTGLVLRPDGIYNLDGTKFTPGGDTDLSKVWESIQETKDGLEENKTQIEINSKEIATKVSTDVLPDAINDQLKPYSESLDALKGSYADVQKTIDNLASDGVISGADKKATRTIWLQIQTEYPATIAQAEANGVDHSSLDAAYIALKSYLEPILSASGDTNVDPTEWDRNFSNYYNASFNVNTAIVAALRKLAQDGYDKAVQAGLDVGSAITQASEASSEDYLTGSDKATLNHVWVQIQNQYPNDVASANAVKVDHSALDSAYNDLSSYISSNNIFADNSTIAIDGSALADKIKAYFSQEATVLKQVADKNIQTLAQYGEDINHQATAIKETSTKIALSAENIQKQGDSLSVMQGQLNIMSNQISGGVSETDVTGIVNDSLSGTGLGSTNQFVISTATKGQYMNGNNGTSASSPNGIISDYISIKASSVYTGKVYGATGTTKLSVAWYDSSNNFISGTEVSGTGDFTNSGSSPSNASYAKVSTDNYNFNTLFISGDAPDTWSPSYIDAKSNASDANILLKSLTNTQAAIASSINANSNKNTANVSSIDSMFAGGNLGSTDIGTLKAILADSGTDNASDNSLATQYGVDISALNNYYSQLQADINGILSQDEGTTVDVDSYKAKLSAYYNSRDTFLKAVKGKLDGQVSSAQESLNNANNTVQEVITNKYANFAVTVDGISTKVGEVSEKADSAGAAASAAQNDLNNFKTTTTNNFSAINQTATDISSRVDTVTTMANNASDKINNLQIGGTNLVLGTASPASITGSNISNENIHAYYLVEPLGELVTQVGSPITLSFDYTITGSLSGTTRVQYNGTPWGGGLNTIPMVSSGHFSQTVLADSTYIGSTATGFNFRLDNFSGTITLSNFKLELGNTATSWSAAPQDTKVGATNLQIDSDFKRSPTTWTTDGTTLDTTGTYAKITSTGTGNQRIYGAGNALDMTVGTQYAISFIAYSPNAGTTVRIGVFNDPSSFSLTTSPTRYSVIASRKQTDAGTALSVLLTKSGDIVYIGKIKVELGNTVTDWSPAPADNASASDLANLQATTTQKFSQIDQTSDQIKQSVTAVTTTANNASDKINNLQVGGTNLIAGTTADFVTVTGTNWAVRNLGDYSGLIVGNQYTASASVGNSDHNVNLEVYAIKADGTRVKSMGSVTIAPNSRNGFTFTWIDLASSGVAEVRLDSCWTNSTDSGSYQVARVKLEQGNTATDWSPAPADNASASDLATTNQTVKTVQTQTANNWSIFAQGIGGTSAGISVDGNGTVTISGNKLVIGSDFIAGNITGKTITGSDFINNYSHVKIDNPNIFRLNQIINSSTDLVVGKSNGQAYTIIPTQLSDMYGNYTFSAQVINANAGQTSVSIGRCDPSNGNNNDEMSDVPIVNGYVTKTFTGLSNPNYTAILVYPNSGGWSGSNGKVITYHHYKLQYGTSATAWIDPGSENIGYVSGNTEISSGFVQAKGYVEDTNKNPTGISYWSNLSPNGFENYMRMPDGQGSLSSTAIKNGIITLTQNVGDPMAPLKYKKYVQSDFRAQDNVTFYWNNTTAYTSGDVSWCYIYYSRRGSLVNVGFTLEARAAQGWLAIAHIRPGYMPYQVDSAGTYLGSMSYAGVGCKLYASAGLWLLIPQLGKGSYSGSTTYLTRDDYPLDDAYF